MSMIRRHEGKACDAVIKRIEAREGHLRSGVRLEQRVELVCRIGGQLFAFEHTAIEPFEQLFKLEQKAPAHFQPIQERLINALPDTEHFVLQVPAMATLGLRPREIERLQDALVDWIKETAPSLPVVRLPSFAIPLRYQAVPGVPFEVFLIRSVRGGPPGQLSVTHLVERNLEEERFARIRRAYQRKCLGQLAPLQKAGARTVLIFEASDLQMTNHLLVAEAIRKIERTAGHRPNEIYLLIPEVLSIDACPIARPD
jgi:hypothetical protein